jgi:hypothetical protein
VPPRRPRHRLLHGRRRPVLTHDELRLMRHYVMDPERVTLINRAIGMTGLLFGGIFGDLNAALHYLPCHTARVIQFPGHRTEIARIRAEIEEMRKTVRGGCC